MQYECANETSSEPAPSCSGLGVVKARLSTYEGKEVAGRLRGVAVAQGQASTIEFDFLDDSGRKVDFGACAGNSSSSVGSSQTVINTGICFKAMIREAVAVWCQPIEAQAVWVEGSTVRVVIPDAVAAIPGVYRVDIGAIENGRIVAVDHLYLMVEPSLFGSQFFANGGSEQLPSRSEIRMALRDSAPSDSYLNEEREWDDGEIAFALVTAVLWFNEQRPPIKRKYTTSTFKWHRKWIEGAIAELNRIAAVTYRREKVSYQASGTALNDKAKDGDYEQIAQIREKEYKLWARTVRIQISQDSAMGAV